MIRAVGDVERDCGECFLLGCRFGVLGFGFGFWDLLLLFKICHFSYLCIQDEVLLDVVSELIGYQGARTFLGLRIE